MDRSLQQIVHSIWVVWDVQVLLLLFFENWDAQVVDEPRHLTARAIKGGQFSLAA